MPTFRVVTEPEALGALADRLRAEGRTVVRDVSTADPGTVYAAEVTGPQGAQHAVLAALRGADLLVACAADDELVDALVEDLHRLGTVVYDAPSEGVLPAEQLALLRRLHAGDSLRSAAMAVHVSRRTADRRLALARAALGVRTTAEALVEAAGRGLLDQGTG